MKGVLGFAVYGSVARGDFKPTSDVDALVVSRDLPRSLAKRVDAFLGVEELLRGEISFLADRGVYTHLSWTPLTPEELARVPPVLLDIAEDGLVVFEKGGFLTKILTLIRGKLVELGASRFEVCGKGYWDLGAKWGELAIELPEAG
ncbi:MAG TPA: nucleotidyltransferase domain-containing protein [Candidatus Latescibacteria bacterium]|nr:nucleotidyltransferase domain-containing protein [Candidatus Latescibacterota bacterium]